MATRSTMVEALATIARDAGAYMASSTERQARQKSSAKDFVTVSDIKAQNLIEHRLHESFPDVTVVSEEQAEDKRQRMYEPQFTGFVIDPIDGTYNFMRDMRESAISIGYIEQGIAKVGVIYDPYKDELYTAEAGGGATRNGRAITVSGQDKMAGASVAISNSYDDAAMARNLKRHLAIYEQSGRLPWTSCLGSGVLILAYVACGRLDAYHHNGLKPWDNAAAFLLVREAGGRVLTLGGEEATFTTPTVLAGNPQIVAALQAVFEQLDPELLT